MVNNFPLKGGWRVLFSLQWENLFPMKRVSNGHSANYIKRQAKNIKKELGITYNEALDKAAAKVGFAGWEHFINKSTLDRSDDSLVGKPMPQPLTPEVLSYRMIFSKKRLQRPNACLPVASHEQIGRMLKLLKRATQKNKRAYNQFADVAFQLDEWVQMEYKTREELSDDVFFKLYYGDVDAPIEYSPSAERKEELRGYSRKVKAILKSGYHDCKPVKELLRKMDQGEKWLEAWPTGLSKHISERRDVLISRGALVFIKGIGVPAILINHNVDSGKISCYADKGPITTSRQSVTVPKNQFPARSFKPQRLWLPYGKCTCPEGKQILFNRDYIPLWIKLPDGNVVQAPANSQIEEGQKEFFFNDSNAPWLSDKKTVARCMDVLKQWGVEDQTPELLGLLPMAISQGIITLLQPERIGTHRTA